MLRIPIVQGEHAVVAEPGTVIATVLGSCIAVCLHDPVARIGGMNHFLLGEPTPGQRINRQDMQRYGVHAMELLINAMMQGGASRARLRAHLYGGATMVAGLGDIGRSNAAFARRFMATEGIAVGRADVGGTHARKVEFLPHEGRVRCIAVADAPPPVVAFPPPIAAATADAHAGELELF